MLLEVFLQHEAQDGCSLAVARDDERAALVVVLKVVVERGGDVTVRFADECRVDVAVPHEGLSRVLHAGLAVVRYEQVGGLLEHARLDGVLHLDGIQHLGVVERRIVGVALVGAHEHCRVDVEGVKLLGDFRHLVPTGLLRIVGRASILWLCRGRVVIATA